MDNIRLSLTDRAGNNASIYVTFEVHEHNFEDGTCTICGTSEELNNWEYIIDDKNKTINLTKYIGTSPDVIVESKYNYNRSEYNTILNGIDDEHPFGYNYSITSVRIANGVKAYQTEYMFYRCKNITSIDLSGLDMSEVLDAHEMFSDCSSLTELNFNVDASKITNSNYMFNNCKSLNNIVLPKSLTVLGNYCFYNTPIISIGNIGSGSSLEIPNSVKIIGDSCFKKCLELLTVDIPEGVEEIGNGILESCINVTTLTIPNTLKKINQDDGGIFGYCNGSEKHNLKYLNYNSELGYIGLLDLAGSDDGFTVNFGDNVRILPNIFMFNNYGGSSNMSKVTDVVILGDVEYIPEGFLRNETLLKSITFSNSITTIKANAFNKCTALKNIKLSDNLKTINFSAFSKCTSLVTVELPETLETIEDHAFESCINLDITIPNNVISIDRYSFENVPHITYHGSATGSPWGALAIN